MIVLQLKFYFLVDNWHWLTYHVLHESGQFIMLLHLYISVSIVKIGYVLIISYFTYILSVGVQVRNMKMVFSISTLGIGSGNEH